MNIIIFYCEKCQAQREKNDEFCRICGESIYVLETNTDKLIYGRDEQKQEDKRK